MKSTLSFIIAMMIFGTIGAVVRFIDLPSSEIALFRGLLGVVCLTPFLFMNKHTGLIADLKANGLILLTTGLVLAGNWIFLFEAYRHTTIALAAISYYTAPVLVMALSPFIMKERVSRLKVVAITVTLIGMVLVVGVGQDLGESANHLLGLVFGFLAAICYASLMLLNKFLKNLSGLETTIPQLFLAALILLPYVLTVGEMQPLFQSDRTVPLLLALGLIHTGLGFLLFFIGIKGLKAQEIAILSYLDPLTSVLISLFIFSERMTALQIAGAILICGSTLAGTLNWQAILRPDRS